MPSNVSCPNCGEVLRVPDELLGRKVRCAACQTVFTAEATAQSPPTPTRREEPSPPPPRRRPRDEADEDRWDDEDDRPRRRDDYEDDEDEERRTRRNRRRQRAKEKVALPATLMIIVGCLFILGNLLGIAFNAAGFENPFMKGMDPKTREIANVANYIGFTVGLVFAVFTIIGGFKMRSLSGKGLAWAGAIVTLLNCQTLCCLLGIPVGIWSIVVLSNEDVSRSFT